MFVFTQWFPGYMLQVRGGAEKDAIKVQMWFAAGKKDWAANVTCFSSKLST